MGVLAVLLPTWATLHVAKKRRRKRIVVVDDNLANDTTFLNIFTTRFRDYEIRAFAKPEHAKQYLAKSKNIAVCLIDLVFRSGTSLDGVALAEFCSGRHIPVLNFTVHALEELGFQIRELEKFGIRKSSVLRKPATMKGYDRFLNKVTSALGYPRERDTLNDT